MKVANDSVKQEIRSTCKDFLQVEIAPHTTCAYFEPKVKYGFSYFTLRLQSKLKFMYRKYYFFMHETGNVYKFYTYLNHELLKSIDKRSKKCKPLFSIPSAPLRKQAKFGGFSFLGKLLQVEVQSFKKCKQLPITNAQSGLKN